MTHSTALMGLVLAFCMANHVMAQTPPTRPVPPLSLSDIDPPLPPPGFHPGPPPVRASGPALRAQALDMLHQKFDETDTAHTGAITAAQAQQANFGFVAKNFAKIDTAGKGVVTFSDIANYLNTGKR
jgi:hypothetical protein